MATVIGKTSSRIDDLLSEFVVNGEIVGGQLFLVANNGAKLNVGTIVEQAPTGSLMMWPTATAPSGYLLCNGGTFSSDEYPELATVLGDTYGTHAGTTYFLPDFSGRSPVGVGTATGATGATAKTLAQKGGAETHTLALSQIPNATGIIAIHGGEGGSGMYYATGVFAASPIHTHYRPPTGATTPGAGSLININYNLGGGGQPHPNMHPFLGINFIIKF